MIGKKRYFQESGTDEFKTIDPNNIKSSIIRLARTTSGLHGVKKRLKLGEMPSFSVIKETQQLENIQLEDSLKRAQSYSWNKSYQNSQDLLLNDAKNDREMLKIDKIFITPFEVQETIKGQKA